MGRWKWTASAGVGLMSFESHEGPPVAAFPLPAFAPTDLDDADMRPPNVAAPVGFRGCHYIMAAGRELWHKAYRCSIGLSSRDAWTQQCNLGDDGAQTALTVSTSHLSC